MVVARDWPEESMRLAVIQDLLSYTIETPNGCKLYMGKLYSTGYGRYFDTLVHRVMWAAHNGPIPEGLEVCHECDIRNCIEITHLFTGTHKENLQHAGRHGLLKGGAWQRNITHCPQGHEYTFANTKLWKGKRQCRECSNARRRTGNPPGRPR